jgi:cytoskeletal protein CcmA (bactofilin family)
MALGHSVYIKGDIVTGEDLTIAGHVEGRIEATGHAVTLAPGSHVVGSVEAAAIDVGGHIEGEILATDRVRVGPEGEVDGDVITARLVIAEGGRVQGRVEMSAPQHALHAAAS